MRFPVGLLAALAWSASLFAGGHWPQFRGPEGNGHANAPRLPIRWSETNHVTWKTPIHDRGWSSPVIWDDQIWLTTATEDGRELYALCVDAETGEILRDLKLFEVEEPQFAHKFNTYASPTPVIEAGRVYVTFGSPGTACLDTESGEVLWTRRDIECNHFRGAGSSPILFEDLLIMNFDGSDHQFVIALDKRTGETVWRANRSIDFQDLNADGEPAAEGDFRKAFSTPHVAQVDGQPMLISVGAKAAYAYDPRTGEEFWRIEERTNHSASTRPVVGGGLVFYPSGFGRGILIAARPDGRGDVTSTHVQWSTTRGVSKKPSVLLAEGLLFMVEDGGVASCLDASTGKLHWQERVGGNYSASPIYNDGLVYFFNQEGKTTIVRAADEFELAAENELEDGFMASPAVAHNALFLRTESALYRIER